MSTEEDRDAMYRVDLTMPDAEPLHLDAEEIPGGADPAEHVEGAFDVWEIGVRPGRWSGEEFTHIAVGGRDQADAEERALDAHRDYSSVIENSQAHLGSAEVKRVEKMDLVTDGGVALDDVDDPVMRELLEDDGTRKFTTMDTLAGTKLRISADGPEDRAKALSDAFSAPARRMYSAIQEGAEFECPECDAEFFEIEEWQEHHLEQHYGEDDD